MFVEDSISLEAALTPRYNIRAGYCSLFEYCKGELGYTDASAWRRARVAQAIVRCPEARDRLREGAVNLCTPGRVHKFITPEVLRQISGESKAEVELIAAAYDAKGVSPDRTRPVMVPKSVSRQSDVRSRSAEAAPATGFANGGLRSEVSSSEQKEVLPLRREVNSSEQKEARPLRSEVGSERLEFDRTQFIIASDEARQKWKIEGVVSKEVKAKLDWCKSLLSSKYPA